MRLANLALSCALIASCGLGPSDRPEPAEQPVPEPEAPELPTPDDAVPREMRGVWVTRWTFTSAEDVDEILDTAKQAGFNTVFFQVRGRFDAFYDSELEPWARELTGTLGEDPGWDPLAYATKGAHERGLALHAWMNTFAMWSGTAPPRSTGVPHAYAAHPDWVVHDAGGVPMTSGDAYIFASPGNPAVKEHVAAVATDIARRYDIDGLHFDYVRYPDPKYSHDPASRAAWGGQGDYGDWQRGQIVDLLKTTRSRTEVPITAAVWGVYDNGFGWKGVSEGNRSYYQDTARFFSEGAVDATLPMIYWPVTATRGDRLDFATLAQHHVELSGDRHVYTGIDATKLTWDQTVQAITAAREVGAEGVVLFEYRAVRDNGWVDDLAEGPFAAPATLPDHPWRDPSNP